MEETDRTEPEKDKAHWNYFCLNIWTLRSIDAENHVTVHWKSGEGDETGKGTITHRVELKVTSLAQIYIHSGDTAATSFAFRRAGNVM